MTIYSPLQDPNAYQPIPPNLVGSLVQAGTIYVYDKVIPGANLFRVPVLKGTTMIGILGYDQQGHESGILARYGQPPGIFEVEVWSCPSGAPGCPWIAEGTGSIDRLRIMDCAVRSGDGVAVMTWQPINPPAIETGWIYCANMGMYEIKIVLQIDAVVFDSLDKRAWVGGNPHLVDTPTPVLRQQQCTLKPDTDLLIIKRTAGKTIAIRNVRPNQVVLEVK